MYAYTILLTAKHHAIKMKNKIIAQVPVPYTNQVTLPIFMKVYLTAKMLFKIDRAIGLLPYFLCCRWSGIRKAC
jgi:hypothetical protein